METDMKTDTTPTPKQDKATAVNKSIADLNSIAITAALYGDERSHNKLKDAANLLQEMHNEHAASTAVASAAEKLEQVATKMLAGGFNKDPKAMHEAIGDSTAKARAALSTLAAIRK